MDFFQIAVREIERGPNKGKLEIAPDFVVRRSKDLLVRGKSFYAIWDEPANLWSTDEYDVQRIIDDRLRSYKKEHDDVAVVRYMSSFGSKGWTQFKQYLTQLSDNYSQLDEQLTFSNSTVKKSDYVSKRLPYALSKGDTSAWEELTGTLYAPEERQKIEWAIGAVVSGDAKNIQKFLVFYGAAGTGKSTILHVIQKLFDGYTTTFEAKALGSTNGSFATEVFRANPLVAIQHDGDLSKIEDNTRLNSIISHEEMVMNEKYKASYTAKVLAFLFMGTNQPVKISDAKSGIIRRLIDVHPTGDILPPKKYHALMAKIDFELGAIAQRCLDIYRELGKNYYNSYRPLEMMFQTDIFFNFIEAHWDIFSQQNGASLKQAYELYKRFCEETGIERRLPQYKVREELRNYFEEFHDRITIEGQVVRSYYKGFKRDHYKAPVDEKAQTFSLVMDDTISIFDQEFLDAPAQLAKDDGSPRQRWSLVKTTLAEIDTHELHYVQVPENHIVIDFDLKDDNGNKSLEANLEAASAFPATYAELSKSGAGVHLHYLWDGDVESLAGEYAPGIEVKRFAGNASLRRRLSRCNNVPIAIINSGLPLKEKKPVLANQTIQSERGLRELVLRNLRKEIHPGTKPSIDFIQKLLDEAYLAGYEYDLTDLRPRIIVFANNSTNQAEACLRAVKRMRFKSPNGPEAPTEDVPPAQEEAPIVFFDIEVYPNLVMVCWKYQGADEIVTLINPTPQQIEALFKFRLIGFFNRRYDNHILWAIYMGFTVEQVYQLSQKITSGNVGAMFGKAYDLSYTDIWDFSIDKRGLKKWEIALNLPHKEMDLPWDQPVPDDRIKDVEEYCKNDVRATEAVFEHRAGDFKARLILAELSGLTPNDTTQKHAAQIIFRGIRDAQRDFVYTDLSKEFPGYVFERGVSTYRGETVGEGGYVYAEEGIHRNVALLDVASMHPTSLVQLNAFGQHTERFKEVIEARLAIKRGDLDLAGQMFDGRLKPFLGGDTKALADALKIAINIVYGLTSAKFDNPFRDMRNVDNIVAKRGALFMIDLKNFLQERGFTVAHIKTDSVKIPEATPEIIEEVKMFGEKYGYTFEHEATYLKMVLINDAEYLAKKDECVSGCWEAKGKRFQHPYVFNALVGTEDELTFRDFCETREVKQGAIYIDLGSTKPMHSTDIPHGLQFVGKTGLFVPVKEGFGGGILYRVQDDKQYAVAGTKGYLWLEATVAEQYGTECIDMSYYEKLVDNALDEIAKYGEVNEFTDH